MSEDLIESVVGGFGRYQALIIVLIIFGRAPTEYQLVNVVFILPNAEYICQDEGANNATNFCPCEHPVYNTDTVMKSVSSQFDLICDRRHLASLGQSMLQVGILFGSVLYGYMSDRYGRKLSCILSLITEVIFVAISAAVTEFWMFAICRFLMGVSVGGTMLCGYVMLLELLPKSSRPYLPGIVEAVYILSYITLPMIAYFISDWRLLQLVTSLPWSFVLLYFFIIPESPRWLITKGRKKEATDILINMARIQKMPTDHIEVMVEKAYNDILEKDEKQNVTYLDLFRTPQIRKYTLIVCIVWMCCSHTFFGVNQYIGRLQGNIYLNVILSALSLIPGLILVILASLFLSRRVSLVASFCVAGLSLLLFLVIPPSMHSVTLTFAIIGLMGAYMSFVQVYLHTSELFPTVVRNSAMGLSSVFARFGGFIAPFVVNIEKEWASILIFSIFAFCSAVLCFFLPNTKNMELFNTISQTENHSRRKEIKI